MKKIGIVGGVAWPSTADYYRLICSQANAHFKNLGIEPPYPTPPITIESLVMHETRKLRGKPGEGEAGWAGFDTACGLRTASLELYCWGLDDALLDPPAGAFERLADGSGTGRSACAIRADDTVACWGDNSYGQLNLPAGAYTQVAVSDFATCGVTDEDEDQVVCTQNVLTHPMPTASP